MLNIDRPTLLVDEAKCRTNIQFMATKVKEKGIGLRPHFKTHQSIEIGRWFRDYGIDRIAVSSVPMAEYFAQDGWNDITIAFPFVLQQASSINKLAEKIKLQLTVSSITNAKHLTERVSENVGVFVEIDTGQGRSGIDYRNTHEITQTIEIISLKKNLRFCGFLSHAGQTYNHKPNEVIDIHSKAKESVLFLKNLYAEEFPDITVSYGDTPSSVLCEDFEGIDELRPGNFVFFDMQQASNGVCRTNGIASALACPVVNIYFEKSCAIIWGGAVHLSKDFYTQLNGIKSFGAICKLNNDLTWSEPIEGLYLESVSQEHGVIRADDPSALSALREGELIAVLPAHICLAVSCMREIRILNNGTVKCLGFYKS
jgi:D-serine deaminase-like pyridoxal phosphate-dependent protein